MTMIANVCFVLLTNFNNADTVYINLYSIKSFTESAFSGTSITYGDHISQQVKETGKQVNEKIIEAKKGCEK